jgi:nucleotide-binding universal stress UspA family protein
VAEDAGRYVLVGVDGSPASHAAVRWAAEQARGLGHELHLLHAREGGRPTAFPALPPRDDGDVLDGEGDLDEALTVRREVVDGRPSRALVEASTGAVMVVLGRPRGGVGPWPGPNSVTRRVLAESACPVVLVPERLGA